MNEMRCKCPKIATNRWLSLENVLNWFAMHCVCIIDYLEKKEPSCKPSIVGWLSLLAIIRVTDELNILFQAIQRHPCASAGHPLSCNVLSLFASVSSPRAHLHHNVLNPRIQPVDVGAVSLLYQMPTWSSFSSVLFPSGHWSWRNFPLSILKGSALHFAHFWLA